jgi:alanine racemase
MEDIIKRAWAEIDLSALEHNYREIRSKLPEGCRFLGVVKADAYSHGAVTIARELERLGADYLAVACLDEAITLREAGIHMPVLILGTTPASYARTLAKYDITQTVCSLEMARELSFMLGGDRLKVHYKIDSGMSRLGFSTDEAVEGIARALRLPNLIGEGIFTHFAVSDEYGDPFTMEQFNLFTEAVRRVEEVSGHHFAIRHCANSGAVINYCETCLDMVRPGLALYGHYPAAEHGGLELRPVLQFKARISALHEHFPGETISYGRKYTVREQPVKVAVVGVGYADGVQRALSGKMDVLINGRRARQIGRICMDMCMVDVTDVPCEVGDVVTIFGTDGSETVSVDELAEKAGTISYELLCALSRRVPRVYLR